MVNVDLDRIEKAICQELRNDTRLWSLELQRRVCSKVDCAPKTFYSRLPRLLKEKIIVKDDIGRGRKVMYSLMKDFKKEQKMASHVRRYQRQVEERFDLLRANFDNLSEMDQVSALSILIAMQMFMRAQGGMVRYFIYDADFIRKYDNSMKDLANWIVKFMDEKVEAKGDLTLPLLLDTVYTREVENMSEQFDKIVRNRRSRNKPKSSS